MWVFLSHRIACTCTHTVSQHVYVDTRSNGRRVVSTGTMSEPAHRFPYIYTTLNVHADIPRCNDSEDATSRWPLETNLIYGSNPNKIKLTDQNEVVRRTIKSTFNILHASIIFQHAFPDALLTTKFIQTALLEASSNISAAKHVHDRILNDHSYFSIISLLVR